jgi:hypothetical protein
MTYNDTACARVSVNQALAGLKRHKCVTQAYVSCAKGSSVSYVTAVFIDGEAMSFKIGTDGLVGAQRILDWLGY